MPCATTQSGTISPAAQGPGRHTERIADALVVTMCSGVSLNVLRRCGLLEREWSLYERLSASYGCVVLLTEGGAGERELAGGLRSGCPLMLVTNDAGLERAAFACAAAGPVEAALAGARTAVVKADQMWGGELALSLTHRLRGAGIRTGLIARGGYPWSRFVAWEAGPDSLRAVEAGAEEGALCRGADVIVGTTERMLDELRWRHGLSPERTRLIPNFVPDGARPDGRVLREPGTILFAGRLVAQKRVEMLIDAAALLSGSGGLRLTIIGEGELEGSLRARARERGVEAEFLPRLPQHELLDRMRRCAVYAQASAYEGHPKTVLEAMACGTPVVVTDAPGLSDVVVSGVSGLVTRPTPESLAAGLRRVLADTVFAAALGREAGESVGELRLDRVVELEMAAHELAARRAGEGAGATPGAVRWGPELLAESAENAAAAWARSLHGYSRRLPPDRRARFCASVDTPIADVIDRGAIETAGGIHPKHALMRYHDFFVERIAPGERVVDLGCGYGAVARSIVLRAHAFVTGMDFSAENLGMARAMAEREGLGGRLHLVAGDITRERARGPDGGEHFDVVVLSNVLEHLAGRERLLAAYAQWYTARTFLIRVPAFDRSWQTAWKASLGVDFRGDPTHETEYTEAGLRAELAGAGLRVTELITRWGEYWVRAEAGR